jgi:hypothetical protein
LEAENFHGKRGVKTPFKIKEAKMPNGSRGRKALPKAGFIRYIPKDGIMALIDEMEKAYPMMRGAALMTQAVETGCRALIKAAKDALKSDIDDLEVHDNGY